MKRVTYTTKFCFDSSSSAVVDSLHILRGSSVNRCGAASKEAALAFFMVVVQSSIPPCWRFAHDRCLVLEHHAGSWMHRVQDRNFSLLAA